MSDVFRIHQSTTAGELTKFINCFLGTCSFRLIVEGDILASQADLTGVSVVHVSQIASVLPRCRYEFEFKQNVVASGAELISLLAAKTHLAHKRIRLFLHNEPIFESDTVCLLSGMVIMVNTLPPLPDRAR